jgi:hypothetical protein
MPTFQSLFEDNREQLKLEWLAVAGLDKLLDTPATADWRAPIWSDT